MAKSANTKKPAAKSGADQKSKPAPAKKAAAKKTETAAVAAPAPAPVAAAPKAVAAVAVAPRAAAPKTAAPAPVAAAPKSAASAAKSAKLLFNERWRIDLTGELIAGGQLTIEYRPERALLPEAKKGFSVQAFAKFVPGNNVVEGQAVDSQQGKAKAMPMTVAIPADARQVQVWFRHVAKADHPAEAWDSNFGHNYRFEIRA